MLATDVSGSRLLLYFQIIRVPREKIQPMKSNLFVYTSARMMQARDGARAVGVMGLCLLKI